MSNLVYGTSNQCVELECTVFSTWYPVASIVNSALSDASGSVVCYASGNEQFCSIADNKAYA